MALIQEPWINKGIKGLNNQSGKILCDINIDNPRAAILIKRSLNFNPLNNFISRDLVAIPLTVPMDGSMTDLVVASAYFPGDNPEEPPLPEVKKLIYFCHQQKLNYKIGCDANAHHVA